jgi:hypothetical protein
LHRRDLDPYLVDRLRELIDRTTAVARRAACGQFGYGRGLRDTASTDTDRGSLQGMGKGGHCARRAFAHSLHQQFSLPFKQLQHIPFEAAIIEGHARKMRAIKHGMFLSRAVTFASFDCGLDHPGLPIAFIVAGTLT